MKKFIEVQSIEFDGGSYQLFVLGEDANGKVMRFDVPSVHKCLRVKQKYGLDASECEKAIEAIEAMHDQFKKLSEENQ